MARVSNVCSFGSISLLFLLEFMQQGILFKFAVDIYLEKSKTWMYGGTEGASHSAAMKAAGHELKGLTGFYNAHVPGLSFPLMVTYFPPSPPPNAQAG